MDSLYVVNKGLAGEGGGGGGGAFCVPHEDFSIVCAGDARLLLLDPA